MAVLAIAFASLLANYILWNRYTAQQTINSKLRPSTSFSREEAVRGIVDLDGLSSVSLGEDQFGNTQRLAELKGQKDYAHIALLLNELAIPEDMIQIYIYAQIEHDISIEKLNQNGRFWKPVVVDPYQLAQNSIEKNNYKREQLRIIFGDEVENNIKFKKLFKPYNDRLGFLSSSQQISLQNLKLERMSDIKTGNISGLNQTSELDSIKELLGEEDFIEYQLRESYTAKYLMQELDYFNYSEHEYRNLFSIRQQSETEGRFRNENALTEDEKIRDYLGEERYQEYQRAKRPAYKKIRKIAKNNNISESNTLSAYQILSESLINITKLRQNTSLSVDERASQIELLISEAKNNVTEQVGTSIADTMVNQVLFSPQITRKALSLHGAPL